MFISIEYILKIIKYILDIIEYFIKFVRPNPEKLLKRFCENLIEYVLNIIV